MRALTLAAALAAACMAVVPVAAQEAAPDSIADNPFDAGAFDAAAGTAPGTAAAGAGAAPAMAPAAGSAGGAPSLLVGGAAVVTASTAAPYTLDSYAATASLVGKAFVKAAVPDYGSLYASAGISQYFLSARSGDSPAFLAPPVDLLAPSVTLTELHYSFDVAKAVFFRVGKQLMAWGPSQVWTPVDFVNSSRADFFSPLDLRQGAPSVRLHAPLGAFNAFLFTDFSRTVQAGSVRSLEDSVSLAGRIDGTVGGFELGLSGLAAPDRQDRIGFDFSGHLLGVAAYGELAYAPAYDDYGSSWMASAGFSRALGDLKKWVVSAEGMYNSTGSDLTGDLTGMAAATPLYMGMYYGYASVKAVDFPLRGVDATLSALANFSDLSVRAALAADFSVPGLPRFTVEASWRGGGADKELTVLTGNDSLSLTLRTRLAF
jgi:hypothetical protein